MCTCAGGQPYVSGSLGTAPELELCGVEERGRAMLGPSPAQAPCDGWRRLAF